MQDENLSFEDYVQMTVDSGVAPLELRYTPIVGMENGLPIAYRASTTVNSVLLGTLRESDYVAVSDKRPVGVTLLKHNIQHTVTAIAAFLKAGRNPAYITVRCPAELVESPDVNLYELVGDVLRKNPSLEPSRLCFEFPASLLERDTERAKTNILDLKVLGVRTALVGCGREEFPLSKLVTVTPDLVFLDPEATVWAGSKDKPQLISSLVSYIRSMGPEVVAEGTDAQRKAMRLAECSGFIVVGGEPLSETEAIGQKEAESA